MYKMKVICAGDPDNGIMWHLERHNKKKEKKKLFSGEHKSKRRSRKSVATLDEEDEELNYRVRFAKWFVDVSQIPIPAHATALSMAMGADSVDNLAEHSASLHSSSSMSLSGFPENGPESPRNQMSLSSLHAMPQLAGSHSVIPKSRKGKEKEKEKEIDRVGEKNQDGEGDDSLAVITRSSSVGLGDGLERPLEKINPSLSFDNLATYQHQRASSSSSQQNDSSDSQASTPLSPSSSTITSTSHSAANSSKLSLHADREVSPLPNSQSRRRFGSLSLMSPSKSPSKTPPSKGGSRSPSPAPSPTPLLDSTSHRAKSPIKKNFSSLAALTSASTSSSSSVPASSVPANTIPITPGSPTRSVKPTPAKEKKKVDSSTKLSTMSKQMLEFIGWDFGSTSLNAQQLLFLASRAIYIVAFTLERLEKEPHQLEYWLQAIHTRAPAASIVLVGLHDGKVSKSFLDTTFNHLHDQYAFRFPKIRFFLPFCGTRASVDELHEKLIEIALEIIWKEGPVSRLNLAVEEKVVALRQIHFERPLMSLLQFESLTIATGIRKARVGNTLRILTQIGSVVHFNDTALNNIVLIDADWLWELLDTLGKLKDTKGMLILSDFDKIWKPPKFPKDIHADLLNILEKFELAYQLPPSLQRNISRKVLERIKTMTSLTRHTILESDARQTRVLVPQLLPQEPPYKQLEKLWYQCDPTKLREPQLARHYHFEFLPSGFFSMIMTRILHAGWRVKECWKDGVLLAKEGHICLVDLQVAEVVLRVHVRGHNCHSLLLTLVMCIENIIREWLHVAVEIQIPCIHCLALGDPDPYTFHLEELEAAVDEGLTVVKCREYPISIYNLAPDITLGAFDDAKIEFEEIEELNTIAQNENCKVYKAKYNNEFVAVKEMISLTNVLKSHQERTELYQQFRREVWLMAGLRDPNIVRLIGVSLKPMALVMEYMEEGTLYDYLRRGEVIDWATRISLALDITRGVLFLHSITPPIIHRDLKSPNILLTKSSGNGSTLPERKEVRSSRRGKRPRSMLITRKPLMLRSLTANNLDSSAVISRKNMSDISNFIIPSNSADDPMPSPSKRTMSESVARADENYTEEGDGKRDGAVQAATYKASAEEKSGGSLRPGEVDDEGKDEEGQRRERPVIPRLRTEISVLAKDVNSIPEPEIGIPSSISIYFNIFQYDDTFYRSISLFASVFLCLSVSLSLCLSVSLSLNCLSVDNIDIHLHISDNVLPGIQNLSFTREANQLIM